MLAVDAEGRAGLTGKEFAALQSLFATVSTYEVVLPMLEERARTMCERGTWRDLRMLRKVSDRVIARLLATVPARKLQQTLMTLDHVRVYVKVEAPGIRTKDPTSYTYVPTEALDCLMNTILDDHCLLCGKTEKEGRKCPLRQAILDAVPHDVKIDRESDKCMFADLSNGWGDLVK